MEGKTSLYHHLQATSSSFNDTVVDTNAIKPVADPGGCERRSSKGQILMSSVQMYSLIGQLKR